MYWQQSQGCQIIGRFNKKDMPWRKQDCSSGRLTEQIAERIDLDFSLSEEQVISKLNKNIGSFSQEEITLWEKLNWLEYRIIDGEKRYFKRSASNLVLIKISTSTGQIVTLFLREIKIDFP